MKLVPASGSPGMRKALSHRYVHVIVAILLNYLGLLKPVARLLKNYDEHAQSGLLEDLEALRINQTRPNASGDLITPAHILELIQTLHDLYQQKDQEDIKYQRGAIIELLAYELVRPRYKSGECLSNHRFVDEQGKYITDQVDVAALSHVWYQIEGYECKLKVGGIESSDCTNPAYLAEAAQKRDYNANIGIISLDDDEYMQRRLKRLQPAPCTPNIKLYGLDSIETLQDSPF